MECARARFFLNAFYHRLWGAVVSIFQWRRFLSTSQAQETRARLTQNVLVS